MISPNRIRAIAREIVTGWRVRLFGVALAPVVGCELVVVHHSKHARYLGFDDRGRHPQADHLRVWWPSMGADDLRGRVIQRVTVAEGVRLDGYAVEIIKSRMVTFGRQAIWMQF